MFALKMIYKYNLSTYVDPCMAALDGRPSGDQGQGQAVSG